MPTPQDAGLNNIASTMRLQGMNTAQIIKALNRTKALVDNIVDEIAPLFSQYSAVDLITGSAADSLNSDPLLDKINKLQQYSQEVITVAISNKTTKSLGDQMQVEMDQLKTKTNTFTVDHAKVKKDIRAIETNLNQILVDVMTKVKSGTISRDEIRSKAEELNKLKAKITETQKLVTNIQTTKQDTLKQFTDLAKRGKEAIANAPGGTPTNLPRLDE